MDNFNQITVENLLLNIEKFYKRFYINRLIKGILLTSGILLFMFTISNLLFFYSDLPGFLRFGLFYLLVTTFLAGLYFGVIDPILRLFHINKGISQNEIAEYIGKYYAEVGDKLINTLQLKSSAGDNSLSMASIGQRAKFLEDFDFTAAVPENNQRRNALMFIVPLGFLAAIWVFNSNIVTVGSDRLVNYSVNYAEVAPFEFEVLPGNQQIFSGDEIEVVVRLKGNQVPDEVFLERNGSSFRMSKEGNDFIYRISNTRNSFSYRLKAGKYFSSNYNVEVLPVPVLSELSGTITFPKYQNRAPEEIKNVSLVEIPYGASIEWKTGLVNSEKGVFEYRNQNDSVLYTSAEVRRFSQNYKESGTYVFKLENSRGELINGNTGSIVVVEDEYPVIQIKSKMDSTGLGKSVFIGKVSDDYGFHSLSAVFKGSDTNWVQSLSVASFDDQGVFSLEVSNHELGSKVDVYFEVRDNDVVNGYKLSRSSNFILTGLSERERSELLDEDAQKLEAEIEKLKEESEELDKNLEKINRDLLEKKRLEWEDEENIRDLVEQRKAFEKSAEQVEEMIKEYNQKSSENQQMSPELMEKQERLEKLFEEVMDEETKEMFRELERLMEELDKKQIQEHMQKMEMNQDDLSKEIERNLEIFKQMKLEQDMEKALSDLEKLAEDQEKLSQENEEGKIGAEENEKQQEELNDRFDQVKEDMKKMDSLNQSLESPNDLDLQEEKQEEVSEEQNDALQKSKDGNQKGASESQKKAAEKMKEMKEGMENAMNMNSSEQQGEDLESLRRLLENLLELSFEQEDVLDRTKNVEPSDPLTVELSKTQQQLLKSSEGIKDSLFALSTRVVQLNEVVSRETKLIDEHMQGSVGSLSERDLNGAVLHEQLALTSVNNLANLLDEIVQQMQQQMQQNNMGTGSCSKPGQGSPKPSMSKSKEKQEQLARQIEKMKKELEKGNSPGKMNPGQMGEGMSEEVAKLAAEQQKIREEIRKMADQLQKEGDLEGANGLKELEQMLEENEEDLINLELDAEFLERQRQIEVKMLEAENAEREREKEETRESENQDVIRDAPSELEKEYLMEKEFELELLRLFVPNLNEYYKGRVRNYNQELEL